MSKDWAVEDRIVQVYAAIQHLQYGRSTISLAEELHMSRFMVGRMVKRAREDGLIEVVPRLPEPVDSVLSMALADKYRLRLAVVVTPPHGGDEMVRVVIARLAARLISELIDEDDVIGLGPGRTIMVVCDHIVDVPVCDIVQLTGAAYPDPEATLHAIMDLRRVTKGRMFPLCAPFVATNTAAARMIAAQPAVRQALQRMERLNKTVLTVGGWPDSSLLAKQLADLGELDSLLERGIVAELGTTLLDAEGREVHALRGRLIGLTTQQLTRTPVRVALGGGSGKRQGVVSVLKSGLANVVVTDQQTARAAMDVT